MKIVESSYHEEFWTVLYKIILAKKGWKLEITDNSRGWIIKGKDSVANFECHRDDSDTPVVVAIKIKKYYDEIIKVIEQCEEDIVKLNLKNFKTTIVVVKDWDVSEVLDEVNSKGSKRTVKNYKQKLTEEAE